MTHLSDLQRLGDSLPFTEKMPVLFLGHGSPMNALEDNEFTQNFKNQGNSIPKPAAILCISAHWYTKGTKIMSGKMPEIIYDFGGFPEELYHVQYPAKGNPELASETQNLLNPTVAEADTQRGLDHGAWSVLKHMYPDADIPVIQLSIDYTKSAEWHFELAKRLSSLRNKGILILGSGNIIHNLGLVDFANFNKVNYGFDWAIEAREKTNKLLNDGNFDDLIHYEKLGKSLQLAIPTPDHYLPLIYTLALKEKTDNLSLFNDQLQAGSLSMTSVKIS